MEIDSESDISFFLDWMLESGVWCGRQVAWREASEFREELQLRILKLAQEHVESSVSEQFAAQLAWLGTSASRQPLLSREIQHLDFSKEDLILQAGLRKSAGKFWKKHKKEILIGAAVLAVVAVVVIVSVSTVGTGSGAAAAAGTAALGAAANAEKKPPKETKKSDSKQESVSCTTMAKKTHEIPALALDSAYTDRKLIFGQTGLLLDGQFSSYQNILENQWKISSAPLEFSSFPLSQLNELHSLQKPSPSDLPIEITFPFSINESKSSAESLTPQKQSPWIVNFFDAIGRKVLDGFDPSGPEPIANVSSRFSILGKCFAHLEIGGINGIATNLNDAQAHAEYLSKLANGYSVEWVHNCSHAPLIDLAEVVTMNYLGISPNTSLLLQDSWKIFHHRNLNNPDAKYLQFCHSQGAIHVRNALQNLPKEIRDRVIVVAIAPAAIISKELCFDSFNYASKNDIVNYGELCWASGFDTMEVGISKTVERLIELRNQLILLEPHPGSTGMDHDFQSLTFRRIIADHIDDYLRRNGIYK